MAKRKIKLVGSTGPYSRDAAIARPRRRTKESRFLNTARADLTAQLGRAPTAAERFMIERIVMVLLRIELMDVDALRSRELSESQAHSYLAWNNTVSRMLRALGLKGPGASAETDASSDPFDFADFSGASSPIVVDGPRKRGRPPGCVNV